MPHNTLLFTMDINTLFPSSPTKQGLDACEDGLNNRTDKSIPTEAAMQTIETVLDNNIFKFVDTHYKQTEGASIGSKLGKNYAST